MIKIEDLCFTYPGAKEATLNKVNMEIEKKIPEVGEYVYVQSCFILA
mgnify:CR=1 FL=1